MRAREFLKEAGLTQAELAKHGGKYLDILLQLAGDNGTNPIEISPEYRSRYGNTAQLSAQTIQALKKTQSSNAPLPPAPFFLMPEPQTGQLKDTKGAWSAIYKSPKFTGLAGKTPYNKGHLNELFMGLAVYAKFKNQAKPVNNNQVKELLFQSKGEDSFRGASMLFNLQEQMQYNTKSNPDNITFLGVVPSKSAQALLNYGTGPLPRDLENLLSSVVLYVNESKSLDQSIVRVMRDPNTNTVEVKSDGTSEAKSTKADLILSIDNTRVSLLSLKTTGSETLGQYSGVTYEALQSFFNTGFNVDLSQYESLFRSGLDKKEIIKNIFQLYDYIVFPQVTQLLTNQTPGKEAEIVKQLSRAANIFARGESLENIEVVKIDDSIHTGNYKVLRFSDSLYDAMKMLDLDARLLKSENGRTLQILVKPDANAKTGRESNKLCQFRSQVMGGYLRNYFEIGPIMVKLTEIG